jgi:hypothetical protein
MNTTGLKGHVIDKAFGGHKNFLNKIILYDGSPHGVVTADFMGQLCWDYTNDNVYINTTATTTWTLVNY